jgi:thiamine-monophosphate kinase
VPTLRELGEFEVIRRLTVARGDAGPAAGDAGVVLDAGDDAAVLRPAAGADLVATTDAFVEGAHFLPGWCAPAAAGARLAQANLSDLAAMAARPRWALLSIGARPESEVEGLVALQSGLAAALGAAGAVLVGGNLTSVAGAAWYSLALLGECPRGAAWKRSGARPGDLVAVSGWPGRAGAGLRLARALGDGARAPQWAPLLEAWLAPRARGGLALALRDTGAVTAAVDVSDGLAGDLVHLCEASGVGAVVDEGSWPADEALTRAAATLGMDGDALRFGPSDDYELILAVDPAARERCAVVARGAGVPLAFVGRFEGPADRVVLHSAHAAERPLGSGYDHFGAV